jgi:hypothetical protein
MFDFEKDVKEVNIMTPAKRKEGCTLIEFKRTENKDAVIFTWREERTKATISMREFLPKRLEAMKDEDWKKSLELIGSRLAHIARAYCTDEEYASIKTTKDSRSTNETIARENWMEVTKIMGKLLNDKIKAGTTGDTALKVVLNKNNKDKKYYAGLPKVPPFISTPNHPKDFTYNPAYDIFEIPSGSRPAPDAENLPQQGADQTNAFQGQAPADSGDQDF